MNKILITVAASLLTLASGASHAQVTLNYYSTKGYSTGYSYDANWGGWGSYAPGKQLSTSADPTNKFWAYCIDPATGTNWSNATNGTYQMLSLDSFFGNSSSAYAQQVTRYTSQDANFLNKDAVTQAEVKSNLMNLFSHAYTDSLQSAVNASAFGMAVWEIIMQDGTTKTTQDNNSTARATYSFGATTGNVQSDGTVSGNNNDSVDTRLGQYLTAMNTGNWAAVTGAGANGATNLGGTTNWTYTVFYDGASPASQTFITVTPGGTKVPVPGTLALAGLGLIGLQRLRRRQA